MSSALSKTGKDAIRQRVRPGRIRTVAIVPAAGYGKRLGLKVKKPLVRLRGRPLITYALRTLNACEAIDGIVVAAEKSAVRSFKVLIDKYKFQKVIDVVVGGRTRCESVSNCLRKIGRNFDIVLIHDAARPFIERSTIEASIDLANEFGGCVVAVPESDTVKLADKKLFIKKTLDRNRIFRAQTPQAFRYDLIKKAYAVRDRNRFTDDASLVEMLGGKVKILEGSCKNIKITTREDLKMAEVLL